MLRLQHMRRRTVQLLRRLLSLTIGLAPLMVIAHGTVTAPASVPAQEALEGVKL